MRKAWTDEAWSDYLYRYKQDKKTFSHIHDIIKDMDRYPFQESTDRSHSNATSMVI